MGEKYLQMIQLQGINLQTAHAAQYKKQNPVKRADDLDISPGGP